jgi:hypothetical protein
MESWRQRGYVPDSDEEDGIESFDSLDANKENSDKSPEPGSLEYIDVPSPALKEGSNSQSKEQPTKNGLITPSVTKAVASRTPHRANFEIRAAKRASPENEKGSISPSGTKNPSRTPSRTTVEVVIPGKPNSEQGSTQKRQSLGKTLHGGNTHFTNIAHETTPSHRRENKTDGSRSSATKSRNLQSSELLSTNDNTPAKTTRSIYDIPSSSEEEERPRLKPSSHKSTPKASQMKARSKSQTIAGPQTLKFREKAQGSSTRASSPDELMLIPSTTFKRASGAKPVQLRLEAPLPQPPHVDSDDDDPLSSVPSSIASSPPNKKATNANGDKEAEPASPGDGQGASREAIFSQLDVNQDDLLPHIDIPEEVFRELPQGEQRRFRKRRLIQLQPYRLDLVQWKENQLRMGLPVRKGASRRLDDDPVPHDNQKHDAYDPAALSSSPPAEEYSQEREHEDDSQALPGQARVLKRRKTSHATPQGSRKLHKKTKPRGTRDNRSASGNPNGVPISNLASSPPRSLEGGFQFPPGWEPPGAVAGTGGQETEDAEFSPIGMGADDGIGIQSISSDTQLSSEEEEDSDAEARAIRRAQRQIRGVLPASHMRIEQKRLADQQKLLQREKRRQPAPQRPDGKGVARKLVRKGDRPTQPATQQSRGLFDLGDSDSDDDDTAAVTNNMRQTATGTYDSSANEGDILEDNRIDYMFAPVVRKAAGPRPKTNSLKRPKSKASVSTGERQPKRPRKTPTTNPSHGVRKTTQSSTIRQPRIGILDAPDVSTKSQNEQPLFLRVAARQAHSRRDAGRKSPTQKFLQLASKDDTEDANESLRDWRGGAIRQTKVDTTRIRARKNEPTKIANIFGTRAPRAPRAPAARALPAPRTESNERHSRTHRQGVFDRADTFVPEAPTAALEGGPLDSNFVPRPVPVPSKQNPQVKTYLRGPQKIGNIWIVPHQRPTELRDLLTRGNIRHVEASAAAPSGGRKTSSAAFRNSLSMLDRHYQEQRTTQNYRPSLTLDRYLASNKPTTTGANLSLKHPSPNTTARPENRTSNPKPAPPRRRSKKQAPNQINLDNGWDRKIPEPLVIHSDDSEAPGIPHSRNTPPAAFTIGGLFNFQRFYPVEFGLSPLRDNTCFHESTFIGSGEFSRSLHIEKRNLDGQGGSFSIQVENKIFNWGSWNDTVSSEIGQVFDVIVDNVERSATTSPDIGIPPSLGVASRLYRLLIKYTTESLVFIDPIDRTSFVTRATELVSQVRDPLAAFLSSDEYNKNGLVKVACFDMVFSDQIRQVACHQLVSPVLATEALDLVKTCAKDVAGLLTFQAGPSEFKALYKENTETEHPELEIRDDYPSVEAYVVTKHLLRNSDHYKDCFEELQLETCNSALKNERDVVSLEAGWRGLFVGLPLNEVDPLGITHSGRRFEAINDNWKLAKRLLTPTLDVIQASSTAHPISYNNYCRILFHRCHRLIHFWGWRECKPVLDTMFDFFAKNALHNLKLEEARESPSFLDELDRSPSLDPRSGEPCFHTFLKIVASGLRFLSKRYDKKKVQNFAWRLLPNHGRVYPKEQPLRSEDLDALRNHHDLLSTLYWAVPDGCRPRLETIRNLVHPATSHREACVINLRSWSRLVRFKLSTGEDVSGLDSFGEWYGFFVKELRQQHSLARKEIETQNTGDKRISQHLVERMISQNQKQFEELLITALNELRAAVKLAPNLDHAYRLIVKTPFNSIFGLFNPKIPRVNSVVSEALQVLLAYAQKAAPATPADVPVTAAADEDTQEFGDWDAIEALWDEQTAPNEGAEHAAKILRPVLYRLLSNCFGADHCPEDAILLSVVECWTSLASVLVHHRLRNWGDYLSAYGDDSWTHLRDTVQTRKFTPLFLAACIEKDVRVVSDCRVEVIGLWMSSLVERTAMMKFQHHLTEVLFNEISQDPLLQNLPFSRESTGRFAISLKELVTRRLSLLSSLFSNMSEQLQHMELSGNRNFLETKQEYSEILQRVMASMKYNYQELGNGTAEAAQGAYVELVQSVIGFLQQNAGAVRSIDPFFTDPASFPLPTHDARFIVEKLDMYELKLISSKEILTFNGFIQSLSERAAIDGQQKYLVDQFGISMAKTYEDGNRDNPTLRTILLQCIFPAYLQAALDHPAAWILSYPIMQIIMLDFKNLLRNIDTFNSACVSSVIEMIDIVCRASCQALSTVAAQPHRLHNPTILCMTGGFVEIISSVLPLVDYIDRVAGPCEDIFVHIQWIHDFIQTATRCLQSAGTGADSTSGNAQVTFPEQPASPNERKSELFATVHRLALTDLQASLRRWAYHQDKYYFTRPGHQPREITIPPQFAAITTIQSKAKKIYAKAAKSFNRRVASLELL